MTVNDSVILLDSAFEHMIMSTQVTENLSKID